MARTRSVKSALKSVFDAAPVPVYVLDENRRIAYCNPACARWTNRAVDEIIGLRCDYHSDSAVADGDALAAGLCPPPAVFAGTVTVANVACPVEAGGQKLRRAQFLPLGTETLGCTGTVVVLAADDLSDADTEGSRDDSETIVLHERLRVFRQQCADRFHLDRSVGQSPVIKRARDQIAFAVGSPARVVVTGPAGSGREHVARTIHYSNPKATAASLVPMDCRILDAELLQTTVSAFVSRCAELATDAPSALLLLELDLLHADAQGALMGFLDIREFELRTIATARTQPLVLAGRGEFREDLACALSTLVIELPPLAERTEDVPMLAQLFLEEKNAEGGRQVGGFTSEALDLLLAYSWAGNADELKSAVGDAHRRAKGPLIGVKDLPERLILGADAVSYPAPREESINMDEFLRDTEVELITRALGRAKGNKAKASRLLGISRARLLRRLSQLGLEDK